MQSLCAGGAKPLSVWLTTLSLWVFHFPGFPDVYWFVNGWRGYLRAPCLKEPYVHCACIDNKRVQVKWNVKFLCIGVEFWLDIQILVISLTSYAPWQDFQSVCLWIIKKGKAINHDLNIHCGWDNRMGGRGRGQTSLLYMLTVPRSATGSTLLFARTGMTHTVIRTLHSEPGHVPSGMLRLLKGWDLHSPTSPFFAILLSSFYSGNYLTTCIY